MTTIHSPVQATDDIVHKLDQQGFASIPTLEQRWQSATELSNAKYYLHARLLKVLSEGSNFDNVFSSPEPKSQGELIGWELSGRPSVRLSVRPSVHTFKNEYL